MSHNAGPMFHCQRPVLNDDVMHVIMSVADESRSISRLMRTCRARHRDGARYLLNLHHDDDLLQFEVDTKDTETKLKSFLAFMAVDHPRRYPHLRKLGLITQYGSVNGSYVPEGMFDALTDFFLSLGVHGMSFTYLSLFDAELILDAHPALCGPIAALPRLKHLHLVYIEERCCELLRGLRSSLVQADIIVWTPEDEPWYLEGLEPEARNPLALLRHSTSTLERLSIGGVQSVADESRYLRVTHLSLHNIHSIATHHFVYSFPNLQELDFDRFISDSNLTSGSGLEDLRAANLAAQRTSGTWPSLNSCIGSLQILYVLGLTCAIRHVYAHEDSGQLHPEMVDTVASAARSSLFSLRILGVKILDPRVVSVLHQTALRQTKVLDLQITFDHKRDVQESALCFSHIVDLIHEVLQASDSITALVLDLDWSSMALPDALYREPRVPGQQLVRIPIQGTKHRPKSSVFKKNRYLPRSARVPFRKLRQGPPLEHGVRAPSRFKLQILCSK
ncbi:hypothetical protein C8Q80DRAFT_423343 [Daedaleopsis nitida]|nr:hypothetical protein C8Q80DRAFT_423343 [Daedaleopsis nitida]